MGRVVLYREGMNFFFLLCGIFEHACDCMRHSDCEGMFGLEILERSFPNDMHLVTVHVRSEGGGHSLVVPFQEVNRGVRECDSYLTYSDSCVLRLLNWQVWNGIRLVKDCSVTV